MTEENKREVTEEREERKRDDMTEQRGWLSRGYDGKGKILLPIRIFLLSPFP